MFRDWIEQILGRRPGHLRRHELGCIERLVAAPNGLQRKFDLHGYERRPVRVGRERVRFGQTGQGLQSSRSKRRC